MRRRGREHRAGDHAADRLGALRREVQVVVEVARAALDLGKEVDVLDAQLRGDGRGARVDSTHERVDDPR
jgi:hypothetical protein